MRRTVLYASNSLRTEEREVPDLGSYDVLLAVEVTGVCRTDRKAYAIGQRDLKLPRVLGHEVVGRVLAAGALVKSVSPGDLVQVYPGVSCGKCSYCLDGNDHLCDSMQIIGFHLDGGFADCMVLRGGEAEPANLCLLPEGIDPRQAALTEPLACSLNLLERLQVGDAECVVIFGAGPLGVLTAQLARLLGARQVAIVEPDRRRRQIATAVSDCQLDFDGQTASRLMQFTGGHGADLAIPCCPGNDAFSLGLEVLAKRGSLGFFSGLTDSSGFSSHELNTIHYRELSLLGSYGCSLRHNREALGLLASTAIGLQGLPAADISWAELPQALASLEPTPNVFTFFHPDI